MEGRAVGKVTVLTVTRGLVVPVVPSRAFEELLTLALLAFTVAVPVAGFRFAVVLAAVLEERLSGAGVLPRGREFPPVGLHLPGSVPVVVKPGVVMSVRLPEP